MMKNLILVYPPKRSTNEYGISISLALLYLAGAARDSGVCDNIRMFDFNTPAGVGKTIDDLISEINSMPGKTVVGVNCLYFSLFPSVHEITKRIKEKFPEVKIAVGGMHPTVFAREIINNCPEIDAVAIGESDVDFPKLLRYLYEEDANLTEGMEGVCLRLGAETVIKPRTCYIQNLDDLPRPGYEFFDFSDYSVDTENWWNPDGIKISPVGLPLITSRSCPNRCSFCSVQLVMGDKYRPRSAESVFEEIKYLYDVYGVNYFRIMDENFLLNRKHVIKICEMVIESGIKVYFNAMGGLSEKTLDEGVIYLMRRAGFIMLSMAVESGSDYIRNTIMGKNISRERIINAFRLCRAAGIVTRTFFIIGMPEDTEETLRETIELINDIDATRIEISPAIPMPGTKLFEQCVRDNLFLDGFNAAPLWTGEFGAALHLEAESDRNLENFFIRPYNLSMERLAEIQMEIQQIVKEKMKAWTEHLQKKDI